MTFANTWEEEKKKYGATNTEGTKNILKRFLNNGKVLGQANMYKKVKERNVNYTAFRKEMIKYINQNRRANVNRVKAQLLQRFPPSVKNAMRTYLPKNGFGIKSQYQKNLENLFIEKGTKYMENVKALNGKTARELNTLVNTYKDLLRYLDMYWPDMTRREQVMALKNGIGYYKRRIDMLKSER